MAWDYSSFGTPCRDAFLLKDDIRYLNHGAYGATPKVVLAAAEHWRKTMEEQPSLFMQTTLPGEGGLSRRMSGTRHTLPISSGAEGVLRAAAERVAHFLGALGRDFVFVANATEGMAAAVRSWHFQPGDEIVTTDHAYGAVRRLLDYVARRTGARIVLAEVPVPVDGPGAAIDAIVSCLGERTRLVVVDHVTSPTGLILPVQEIVELARRRGVLTLVDGAHAPGMLDLDIPTIGADVYVGNCHKWMFAPKSCGFLWAKPEIQDTLAPLAISHGSGKDFLASFDWTGTRDPGSTLATTAAIDFIETIGAERLRDHNRALALEAAQLLAERWGAVLAGPKSMLGAMAALRLPSPSAATFDAATAIHDHWLQKHRIEIPVIPFKNSLLVRLSAQIYNEIDDYRALAEAGVPDAV